MLTELWYSADQSPSAFQSVGYRMPKQLPAGPAKFKANDYTHDNGVPTYGDAKRESQPVDGLTRWNPRGYEWNGADRVEVTV